MRKIVLCLLLAAVCSTVAAKNRVIENPDYEFSNSGLYSVPKIELGKEETRLWLKVDFLPGWWVQFDTTTYIRNCDTGDKYFLTGMEKGELGTQIPMPESGDSLFVLIFPPLDKSVKKIYGRRRPLRYIRDIPRETREV